MVQCFPIESNSLLLKNGSFSLSFLSFVLSFCKSNDITMATNTDAANMQKSKK